MKARPQMLAGGNDIYAETGMDQPAPKKPLLWPTKAASLAGTCRRFPQKCAFELSDTHLPSDTCAVRIYAACSVTEACSSWP